MHLDKVYSGNVNIIGVGVWADTGNVAEIITSSNQTNHIFLARCNDLRRTNRMLS